MGQETRERVLELRCPVTVPREIGSLSRMNDDRTNIIVSQQRRDLVFGDWASAAIFVPRRVWIGEKLLFALLARLLTSNRKSSLSPFPCVCIRSLRCMLVMVGPSRHVGLRSDVISVSVRR